MTRQMPVFVGFSLDSESVLQLWTGSPDDEVAITLGCSGNKEAISVTVRDDPAVLDWLRDLAEQGAAALRAKLARTDAEIERDEAAYDERALAGGLR